MKKAMFITHSAKPAGAELALLRLVAEMDRSRVTVMFTADGQVIDQFRNESIDVYVLSEATNASTLRLSDARRHEFVRAAVQLIRSGWSTGRHLRDSGTEVVVANSVKSLLLAFVAARRARIPLVWAVHDRLSAQYLGRVMATLVRILGLVLPDAYIVNSRSTQSTVRTGRKPVLLAPPGIRPVRGCARDVAEVVRHVVMVGRLSPWKGQSVFLKAFADCFTDSDVRAELVGGPLFGEESYESELRTLAMELGIADRVLFTGHVDDVQDRIRGGDMLVHCSIIPEPFGLVVLEGLGMGCPVIASKPGGPSEIITDGIDGLLVDCGDVAGLTSAMRTLADDADMRRMFRAAGIKRAEDFDVSKIAATVTAWLDHL